jgi:dihydrofolate reductase
MRTLSVFNFVTLNGFFEGPKRDIRWAHETGSNEYAEEAVASGGGPNTLLFGRVTYELMASYWPSPAALRDNPAVARGMNSADKIVFSRTLQKADWSNTRIVKDHIEDEVRKMKQLPGGNLTLLGSGSIVTQFAEQGLIDEYQIMVHPLALGDGTPMFKGMKDRLNLKLTETRTFKSGTVLLCYRPKAAD